MTDPGPDDVGELRPSYRTLNEPTRLIGLSLSAWAAVIAAGGAGYAFLGLSPLPWRLNFSVVVIGLGAPVILLILREPGTIGPGRLLAAVFAWRLRTCVLAVPSDARPLSHGAVRLDAPPAVDVDAGDGPIGELPWTGEASA